MVLKSKPFVILIQTKIISIEEKGYQIYRSADEMIEKADINTVLLTLPNHLQQRNDHQKLPMQVLML